MQVLVGHLSLIYLHLFISGVFFYFWSRIFTINNRKMHTFELLIVKDDTLRLLIVKFVSYD